MESCSNFEAWVPSVSQQTFVGLALILRNVWVYLHYAILSTPQRGGRVINLELLPLKEMLLWLLRVAEQEWGQVNTIQTERHVETAFTVE